MKTLVWFFISLLIGFCWVDRTAVLKFSWYALNLKDQIGLPFLVVFLLCLPYFLRSGKNKVFLLIWIVVPYTFFTATFFSNDLMHWQSRFVIAYLPAVALICSSSILNNKAKIKRIAIISSVLILGAINFFHASFGLPIKNDKVNRVVQILTQPGDNNAWLVHRPITDNYWKVADILKWIDNDMKKTYKERVTISLLVDTNEINHETFRYYAVINDLPFEIFRGNKAIFLQSDYIVSLADPVSWHWKFLKKQILGLYDAFKEVSDDFILVKTFEKSDNTLYIYRNKNNRANKSNNAQILLDLSDK